jgi:acyl-[acyl-carrier-protein] desaturase
MQDMTGLLSDLEPTVASLINRHLATTKEWFPHELVPYHRGKDFEAGVAWSCDDTDLGGAQLDANVRSALFVNLLTEDNLPFYFRDVESMFGRESSWGEWGRRWTAEEGRHAIVIRDYLTVSRAVDPVALERGRMAQVSGGDSPSPGDAVHGMVYVTLQELATRIAHRNTGKLIGDRVGYEVMARVAADENLHHLFYRDLTTKAIERDPSPIVIAAEQVVRTFAMPGTGIVDFDKHSARIAEAGIYDLQLHYEQVLVPVILRQWTIDKLTGLSEAAERARDSLMAYIERLGKLAARLAARRERQLSLLH